MEEPCFPQIQRRKHANEKESEKNLCHAFGRMPDDYNGRYRKCKGRSGSKSVKVHEYGTYGRCYGDVRQHRK